MFKNEFWSRVLLGLGAGLLVAAVARGGRLLPAPAPSGGAEPVLPGPVTAGPVTMRIAPGSTRVLQGSGGELVLDVELAAAAGAAPAERAPSHIAVVIDRSGSMAGEKLEKTKAAVGNLLERLGAKDRIAVIAYDGTAKVVVPSTSLEEPAARARVSEAVRGLAAGGSTDIAGGLETGAAEVRTARRPGESGRVLLLTDGLATAGITDPAAITAIARAVKGSGIDVSTFGVGVDFNERLMLALADAGGGTYAYIQDPAALGPVFEQELSRIARTAAKDVLLALDLAPGVALDEVYSWPHERSGSTVKVRVGDIEAGRSRHVTLRLKVPTGAAGAVPALAGARVEARDVAADGVLRAGEGGPLVLACTPNEALVAASRDAEPVGRAAACDAGATIAAATLKLQAGDRDGARILLEACAARIPGDSAVLATAAGATATAQVKLFFQRVQVVEAGSFDAQSLAKEGWSAGTALQR